MKKTIIGLMIFTSLMITGCTDAFKAKVGGIGSKFKVEMINCDGTVSRTWISTGYVRSEESSDGYYFNDAETDMLVEVTGRLVITRIED